ncbi:hypothetical protein [Herpetosiphon gulosus]|uniref:Transposase n=1 Tax=Herpetosiphon gulosus TaxID=1973496 RepID=A0ABP9WZ85_9CHLR
MALHELTNTQFAVIAPILPTETCRGRPWNDHQCVVNGLFWQRNTMIL